MLFDKVLVIGDSCTEVRDDELRLQREKINAAEIKRKSDQAETGMRRDAQIK